MLNKNLKIFSNKIQSKFEFDYTLTKLKHLRELIKKIENNFCKNDVELKAARFIHTMHRSFGKNQLVSSAKSQFFVNRKIHLWFRLMNYLNRKLFNYRYQQKR